MKFKMLLNKTKTTSTLIVFMLGVLVLSIIGCVTAPKQEEIAKFDYGSYPTIDYKTAIKKKCEDMLYEPYSAYYEYAEPQEVWYKDGLGLVTGYIVPVKINAKNRMGGYVGKKIFGFIFKDNMIIKVLDDYEMSKFKGELFWDASYEVYNQPHLSQSAPPTYETPKVCNPTSLSPFEPPTPEEMEKFLKKFESGEYGHKGSSIPPPASR